MQNTEDQDIAAMITAFDDQEQQGQPQRIAFLHHRWIRHDDLLQVTGNQQHCTDHHDGNHCTSWYGWDVLNNSPGILSHNGYGFGLAIQRPPTTTSSQTMGIDINETHHKWFEIEGTFVLPSFDLPEIGEWHPAWRWCQHWWNYSDPIDEVQIYYDGSCTGTLHAQSSIGVAAFVRVHRHWFFAGAFSATAPSGTDSYKAEQLAGTTATKFLYDILEIANTIQTKHIEAHLCFDSLTVGKQSVGLWKSDSSPATSSILRSLTQVCQTKFDVNLHHWRVRSHKGEPGNELVDELARLAIEKEPLRNLDHWFNLTSDKKTSQLLEWAWMLYDPYYMQQCRNGIIHIPKGPKTSPTVQDLQILQNIEPHLQQEEQGELQLHLCTYNAMTMNAKIRDPPDRLDTPSSMECILRQMHEAGVSIFGIQETKLKTRGQRWDHRYNIYTSDATTAGHYGIMIGITKVNPIGKLAGGRPASVADQDIGVLRADPR